MNRGIRRKLMEAENLPTFIENWYRRATALDRNWRESRKEKERLRGKKEMMGGAPKQEQRQIMPRSLVWQRRQQPPQQATTASSAGDNRACSNGRSGEDKRSHSNPSVEGRVSSKEPICHRRGQKGEQDMFHLWRIRTYSKIL